MFESVHTLQSPMQVEQLGKSSLVTLVLGPPPPNGSPGALVEACPVTLRIPQQGEAELTVIFCVPRSALTTWPTCSDLSSAASVTLNCNVNVFGAPRAVTMPLRASIAVMLAGSAAGAAAPASSQMSAAMAIQPA